MAVYTTKSVAELTKKLKARAKDIRDRVESLKGVKVVVGIPKDAKYPNGKSVAEVAQLVSYGINENGSPMEAGPRRFLTVAAEENQSKWSRILQDGVRTALRKEKKPKLSPMMMKLGERMQEDIRKTMREMDIYDTGRMVDSISILKVNDEVLAQ